MSCPKYGYLRKRGDRLDADLEVYGFQNLSILSEDDRVPFIFPRARLRWDSGPAVFGGRIVAVGDALALAQDDGRRNRRLSVEGRWERSFPRATPDTCSTPSCAFGRMPLTCGPVRATSPSAIVALRASRPRRNSAGGFPLVRPFADGQVVVEPVLQALAAPEGLNRDPVPNTDSVDVELSHASLFEPNRFPGLDRVEGGVRVQHGGARKRTRRREASWPVAPLAACCA